MGAGAVAAMAPGFAADPPTDPAKPQNDISADEALERLIKGNKRYVDGTMRRHDFATERRALASSQNPFAGILSCSDSRIGPEFTFDTVRGDLFVVRIAGNFLSEEGLASFEYTTAILGTPLLVVLGHDSCGAVEAAIKVAEDDEVLPGHLPGLVHHLKPAVDAVFDQDYEVPPTAEEYLALSIKENVRLAVKQLQHAGPVVAPLVESGKVKVVGAIYRLETGEVEFLA